MKKNKLLGRITYRNMLFFKIYSNILVFTRKNSKMKQKFKMYIFVFEPMLKTSLLTFIMCFQ